MNISFFLRRFVLVFVAALVVIAGAQLLKGRPFDYAATHGLIWATLSACLFTATAVYKTRKGQQCAVCTPESSDTHGEQVA